MRRVIYPPNEFMARTAQTIEGVTHLFLNAREAKAKAKPDPMAAEREAAQSPTERWLLEQIRQSERDVIELLGTLLQGDEAFYRLIVAAGHTAQNERIKRGTITPEEEPPKKNGREGRIILP